MKVIIMGVSGSGKTTIGKTLANKLNYSFYDADDFHPESNVAKMASGKPLNDGDRFPWLKTLANNLYLWENVVLACSALKESYRQILQSKEPNIQWVYLDGTKDTLLKRIESRKGHYMKSTLLDSQLETLEPPSYGLHVSIDSDADQIITQIINKLIS